MEEEAPVQSPTESLVFTEGIASRLMDALTSGVVLAGLALHLGATNAQFGVLAALPFFAQVAQLPAVALLMRVADRRRVAVLFTLGARLLLVVVAGLSWTARLTVPLLVGATALLAAATVVSTAAWNAWMRDAIDGRRLGRFFAFRQQAATLVGALALVGGGWLLDRFSDRPALGYAVLYAGGAVVGFASVWLLAKTPQEGAPLPSRNQRRAAILLIWDALRQPGSLRMAAALGLVSCSLAAALPFSSVYLLRGLGYSFLAATGFVLASQVAYLLGLRMWGGLSDRHGNRPGLQVALVLLAVALAGWSVAWQPGWTLSAYLVALHAATGLAVGGLELMGANILLKTAPKGTAAPYLAGFGLARAAAAGTATILAGVAWQAMGSDVIAVWHLASPFALVLRGFNVLTLASAALAIFGVVALSRVPEPASTGRAPEVARALRREVLSLSSIAGLRSFAHAGSYIVESLRPRPRPRRSAGRAPPPNAPPPAPPMDPTPAPAPPSSAAHPPPAIAPLPDR